MQKLAWAMIVKGDLEEAQYLDRCLASLKGHVDGFFITITHKPGDKRDYPTEKVAKKYGARISDFEWCDNFAAARNFNFSQVPAEYDFIGWCDADDIVEHAEKLRKVVEATPPHVGVVFLNYDYQVDDEGVVRVKQWRDRLLRNGALTWKGRLHETPIDVRRTAKAQNTEVNIIHTAKPERWSESSARNMRILQKQMQDERDNPDPRTFFYLAACYREIGANEPAKDLYETYLKLSGWDEERAVAECQLAEIAFDRGDDIAAIHHFGKAIDERPDAPMGYIGKAKVHMNNQQHGKAINWLEMALSKPEPKTSMVLNPLEYTYKPWLMLAECKFAEGKLNDAIACAKKAQTYRDDELTRTFLKRYKDVQGHKLACEAFTSLAQFLELTGEPDKVPLLLEATPAQLQDNPLVLRIRKKYTEPKVWPKKSVAIFTGGSAIGEWGPWSLADGIGGSEEAVIRLSRRLVEQGYAVTVYGNPGSRATEDSGVLWRNYWELDLRDTFDVFVCWRSPYFFDAEIKARKTYLWLHDVMEPGEFTPARLAKIDKVIVLSKYHRSLFPMIPDDKIFLSANGIDGDEFIKAERADCCDDDPTCNCGDIVRAPHTIVYQSSHVRGLSHIYDIWPAIKAAVPDAKLRVMYGWDSYMAIHKNNPERMEWMHKMQQRLAELPDVVDLGKVGQEQIIEELLSAGVWAYPCPFPEISCITAMKAQAGGAIPVSSTYAALAETVQFGYKMDMPEWNETTKAEYTKLLIEALTNPKQDRAAMMREARKRFSWKAVAEQWVGEFNAN